MQEFMRRWTGVIIIIIGAIVIIMGIGQSLVLPKSIIDTGILKLQCITSIIIGLALVLAGVAINGISVGMSQLGGALTEIVKGLQAR
jgi:hypothetical protein